jgi:hypothetical protein
MSSSQYDEVVWRPDLYGSILFLVASAFAVLALGRVLSWRPREVGWWIAWLNMVGSIAFMVSAVAAYVLPKTGSTIDVNVADKGTFVGAVCFFLGALLMIPAWRRTTSEATRSASAPPPSAS